MALTNDLISQFVKITNDKKEKKTETTVYGTIVEKDNKTVIGFYANNSHRVVEISDCLINGNWVKGIIEAFKQYFIECNVKGYDEINHKGEVREITVKEVKDNLLITVVTLGNQLKRVDRLIEILKEKINVKFYLRLFIMKQRSLLLNF